MLACGTDTAGKHQIELLRFADLVVSVRVTNVVFSAELADFRTGIVI
jgi:hypothetical protein